MFAAQSLVDWGDLAVTPGNAERTAAQIHDGLRPLVAAGVTPLVLGGDHSIVLGELRAHAERHGPLGARPDRRARRHVGRSTTASATSTARRSGARWRRG